MGSRPVPSFFYVDNNLNPVARESTTSSNSIVNGVSIEDVLRLAGYEQPNRRGFVICPLHAERTASFHIVGDGRGFRCFGCNAKGGVLDLVVALGVAGDYAGAARWLEEVLK
jgi:hypothetical protein